MGFHYPKVQQQTYTPTSKEEVGEAGGFPAVDGPAMPGVSRLSQVAG